MKTEPKAPGVPGPEPQGQVLDIRDKIKRPTEAVVEVKPSLTQSDVLDEGTRKHLAEIYLLMEKVAQEQVGTSKARSRVIARYRKVARRLADLRGIHLNVTE
jgi:hypothetical protein